MAELDIEQRSQGRTRVGVMILLVGLLHLPSVFNPFFIDDYIYLDTVHDLSWSGIPEILTTATMDEDASGVWWTPVGLLPFYRPLTILTFALDYQVWGMNPIGYHLTNLLLHLLCTFLTWRLAKRLFSSPRLAFVAATLFALHPIHTEAVIWISGRFDLTVCAAILGSVLCYLNWRERKNAGLAWGAACLACFVVGLGCKETALILPAALVAFELLLWKRGETRRTVASYVVGTAALTAISLVYLAGRFQLFGGLGTLPPPYGVDLSSPSAVGVILWNISQYLLDFVFCVQIDAIYVNAFWVEHVGLLVAATVAAVALLMLCCYLAGRSRLFWIGAAWAILFTAPALMAMPGERNIYLSSVGVALIGASVFAALIERFAGRVVWTNRLSRVAVAVVVVFSITTTVEHALMGRVGAAANKVYDDLLAALPDPPPDARIFVVNQCPLNAVGFTQGVQRRFGRDDIIACALAVAPQLEGVSKDTVYRTGPASIRIVRTNGVFFESFIEKFLLFNQPPSVLPESAERMDLRLTTVPESFNGITELELTLPLDLDEENVFLFTWDNGHIKTLADLIWGATWPKLVRCPLADLPDAFARN